MISNTIRYGTDVRQKLMSGVDQLADAVSVTLGPRGRNVCIEKSFGGPLVTKDGVSVAKEVDLEDPWENMGARMVREVASKTCEDAGDGTTTSIVLARSLYREGLKLVEAGYAPVFLKKGMDAAAYEVIDALYRHSLPVKTRENIENVAVISSNGDTKVGKVIADAVAMVGRDGVITIEDGHGMDTTIETVDGYRFDQGYASNHFVSEGSDEVTLENCRVLVTDLPVTNPRMLTDLLNEVVQTGQPLAIIAYEYGGEAIPFFLHNKKLGILNSVLVRSPGFGRQVSDLLEDVATFVGANFYQKALGMSLADVKLEDLGFVETIRVSAKQTLLTNGGGSVESISARVNSLKAQANRVGSEYDKDKIQSRISALNGGFCTVKVGAMTETELKEIKARMEDALGATKAAIEDGIVVGGGVALIRAASDVAESIDVEGSFSTEEERLGFRLVLKSCYEPFKAILRNSGDEPERYLVEIENSENLNVGFNAATSKVEDLIVSGVIDPTKVVLTALTNAVSVVGTMLTTEAAIRVKSKETPES